MKVDNGTVDIIIPCYNSAQYLPQAIESALEQTYPHITVLVVDDGSTDATRQVVESYGDSVRYVYQGNAGRPGARNTGVYNTDGDYVSYLDADDVIFPSKTADLVEFLEENPEVDMVHGKTLYVFGNDLDHSYAEDWRPYAQWLDYLVPLSVICPFSMHSALIRRRVFTRHGVFPLDMTIGCEDWAFWLKCCLEGCMIGFLPKVNGLYRHHDFSSSVNRERVALRETALMGLAVSMFARYGITEQRKLRILSCGITFIALKWLSLGKAKEYLSLIEIAQTVGPGGADEKAVEVLSRVDCHPLQYLFLAEELYDLGVPELAISCLVQAGDIRAVRQAAGRYGCIPYFDETIGLLKEKTRALMDEECRSSDGQSGTNQPVFSRYAKLEAELPRNISFYAHAFFQFSLLSEYLGRGETAMKEVEEAVSHNPNSPYARLHRAKLLMKAGSCGPAVGEIEQASLIDPEAVCVYFAGAFKAAVPHVVRELFFQGERADRMLRRMFSVVPLFVKFTRSVASGVKKMMNR